MASDENNFSDTPFTDRIKSGLYVVATPIGNLGDITARALRVLKAADVIACEDTRMTAKLMTAFGMKGRLIAYHEHNGDAQRPKILASLDKGEVVALVSDAGTPLISDPGYKLVQAVQETGHLVTTCPGPSALITALTLAGMATDRFTFAGFPPHKSSGRHSFYGSFAEYDSTLVFYESARRLTDSLMDAMAELGDREASVCRELTKKFEEIRRAPLSQLIDHYTQAGNPKGEVVLVIERGEAKEPEQHHALSTEALLVKALGYLSVKDASAFVADLTGEKKKTLYARALEIKDQNCG